MESPQPNVSPISVPIDYGSTNRTRRQFASPLDNENRDTSLGLNYQNLSTTSSTRNLFPRSNSPAHSLASNKSSSFVKLPSRFGKMSLDTMPNSECRQISQRIEFFLNVINQICIGFVTIYMSWLCLRTGLAGTGLHAWLVTIGFSFLMAEGIMCHYSGNVLTFNYKRVTKTTLHWILQALGGGCGVAGALIKLIQKGFLLQSIHGKLGFATFIICLISMMSGMSALFSTNLKKLLSPLLNKTAHNFLGIATFVLALVTQYYGYQTGFFSRKTSEDFQIMIKCITLVSLVLSCFGPLKALYHKICNIIRHFS